MNTPLVSFIVPCYKLGHFLSECIRSIQAQTFADFEIIILDDCSPDNTREVGDTLAAADKRIRYIRHETNLGHLRTFNEGIELSRGKYIWLISADDLLRRPYVLSRYVDRMERYPRAGYACCPAVGLRDGVETPILNVTVYGGHDRVVPGHRFLKKLLKWNFIPAAAGMVRRECYERLSTFRSDFPWAGDWYLWSLFALYYDVAYFAEPMVCYREHDLNITKDLTTANRLGCLDEELRVVYEIKRRAFDEGFVRVFRYCLVGLGYTYGWSMLRGRYGAGEPVLSWPEFEASLDRHAEGEREKSFIRAQALMVMGDEHYAHGDVAAARRDYAAALEQTRLIPELWAKGALLALDKPGRAVRSLVTRNRNREFLGGAT